MNILTGSCLCGSVTFQVAGSVRELVSCHCSECRKAYGSAFGVIAVCESKAFTYTNGEEHISAFVQSANVTRRFCKRCGSQLPIREDEHPLVGIPAGLINEDLAMSISEHIFVGSKADWWSFDETSPRYEAASPSSLEKRNESPSA
jgi:hypothetical protein